MKSSTMNVETSNVEIPSNEEEVFHESSESFQEESFSASLNDDVQQSSEEVAVPSSNTQSFSNNMVPNVDEASTSRNVFNERLEDAYFNVNHVYALDKALYGLKQAPWAWYDVLSQFLIESGFKKGSIDTTLFIKKKDLMVKGFETSMMGEMKFILGLQVNQFSNEIFINQSKYILDILKRFGMENCDTVSTPMVKQAKLKLDLVGKPVDHTDYRSMIGSLLYVTSSRPDIMFAICEKLVCWSSKKQNYVSISTAKSKYVAVSGCCAQVLWMRTQLTDYGFFYDKVPIHYDSKSAIAISCNP
nr:hypothetical protein [Tanacetum cinerariifolium]